MLYIGILLYVMAGVLGVIGVLLFYKVKTTQKFGKSIQATVQNCIATGFGPTKKYNATVMFRIGKKKYKSNVQTSFIQELSNGMSVFIRYNPRRPEDVKLSQNDAYRVFLVIAAVLVLAASFLTSL
ncbi:MAG: hypothetical protein PHX08_09550 [Lachnospiraceae bacterium]|nr:hypothetical protein [Lachnospiraceae bacterium]